MESFNHGGGEGPNNRGKGRIIYANTFFGEKMKTIIKQKSHEKSYPLKRRRAEKRSTMITGIEGGGVLGGEGKDQKDGTDIEVVGKKNAF